MRHLLEVTKMEARVENCDEDIEELVTIQVAGQSLACFASVCPYRLECGRVYPVSLELFMNEEYVVVEAASGDALGFERIGQTLAYWLCGALEDGVLDVNGIRFGDEVLRSEYGRLNGRRVKMRADRLDVEFLPQKSVE